MEKIIEEIREELKSRADESKRMAVQNYFKEKIINYGIGNPEVHKLAKIYLKKLRGVSKNEILNLCEILWQPGYIEESFVASDWAYSQRKGFEPADWQFFEKWIRNYVSNWASCDAFCNHTVAAFIEMYPDYIYKLKEFATSENRWVRRAAAVTLILPAKRGKFLEDVFEIAGILLTDVDDMVQKGYGWMLKVASQAHQAEVFDYVMKNKSLMSRTALRYAIEKMPKELKEMAMKK